MNPITWRRPLICRLRGARGPALDGAAPASRASVRKVLLLATTRSGVPPASSLRAGSASSSADVGRAACRSSAWTAGRRPAIPGSAGRRRAAPTAPPRAPRRCRRRVPASRRRCPGTAAGRRSSRTSAGRPGRSALASSSPVSTASSTPASSWTRASTSAELPASRTAEVAKASSSSHCSSLACRRAPRVAPTSASAPSMARSPRLSMCSASRSTLLRDSCGVGWAPEVGIHHQQVDGVRTDVQHSEPHARHASRSAPARPSAGQPPRRRRLIGYSRRCASAISRAARHPAAPRDREVGLDFAARMARVHRSGQPRTPHPGRPDLAVLALDLHLRPRLPRRDRGTGRATAAAATARSSPTTTTCKRVKRYAKQLTPETWQYYKARQEEGHHREGLGRRRREPAADPDGGRRLRVPQPARLRRRRGLRAARAGAAHRPAPAGHQARGLLAAAGAPRAGMGDPAGRHPDPGVDGDRVRPAGLGRGRPRPALVVHLVARRRTSAPSRCTSATGRNWPR